MKLVMFGIQEQVPLLLAVVDAVHDLIEGKGREEALKRSLRKAFIEGGSGTDATCIAFSSCLIKFNGLRQSLPKCLSLDELNSDKGL